MNLRNEILFKASEFKQICQNHNVKYLYIFGSSLTEQFDPEKSDIDMIVEIDDADPIGRGEKLISIWDNFEKFFKRKVDLLTEPSIKNPYLKKSINSTKVLVYDSTGQKILI